MDEIESIIARYDEARQKMQFVVDHIDSNREIYPTWKVKELIAHLAGWDDATIEALTAFLEDRPPSIEIVQGIDVYNAQSVETRKQLPYERVIHEWRAARVQVKTLLRQIPPESLDIEFTFPWGGRGTVIDLTDIFIHHETTHAQEIVKLLNLE